MAAIADAVDARKAALAKLEEARTIFTNPNATAEEKVRGAALVEDAKTLQQEALRIGEEKKTVSEIEQMAAQLKAAHNGSSAASNSDLPDIEEISPVPYGSRVKSVYSFVKGVYLNGKYGKKYGNLSWFVDEAPKNPDEHKDMSESVGASGGFLVPTEALTQLMQTAKEQEIIRSLATIIRMRSRQISIPVLDQTSTTAGVPHWMGGIVVYWAEEAASKTASDAAFRQATITAHKMVGYTRVSDELLDDSVIALSDFLMGDRGFPAAIAWQEDYAFLRGSGAGQPLGILNSPATISIARRQQHDVTYDDCIDMVQSFLPTGRGMWIAHQSMLGSFLRMNGPSANPNYVWGPGPVGQTAMGGVSATFLGMPIRFTEKLPYKGTAGDLILIDPSFYLIGDRQATTVASTIYDRFQFDQTSFRVVHRVGGRPWLSAPFTLADAVQQVSPFVMLGAKASS